MNRVLVGLAIGLALGLTSCGGGAQATVEVSGLVTLDGQPLPDGQIAFLPEAGGGVGGSGPIKDGRYSVRAQPGKNTVQITASKMLPLPAGKTGMMGAKEEARQYIPDQYNAKSKLTADVGAVKEFPFTLTSK